jgi:hypothetical protein
MAFAHQAVDREALSIPSAAVHMVGRWTRLLQRFEGRPAPLPPVPGRSPPLLPPDEPPLAFSRAGSLLAGRLSAKPPLPRVLPSGRSPPPPPPAPPPLVLDRIVAPKPADRHIRLRCILAPLCLSVSAYHGRGTFHTRVRRRARFDRTHGRVSFDTIRKSAIARRNLLAGAESKSPR